MRFCFSRLNSKVRPRDVAVQDLVTDLSDGVSQEEIKRLVQYNTVLANR